MSLRKIVSTKLRELRKQDEELKERLILAAQDSQYYMTSDDAVAVRHTLRHELEQVACKMECYTQVLHWIYEQEKADITTRNRKNDRTSDSKPDVPASHNDGCDGVQGQDPVL